MIRTSGPASTIIIEEMSKNRRNNIEKRPILEYYFALVPDNDRRLRKNRSRLPSVVYRLGHYAVNVMGVNFPRDSRSMQPGKTPFFIKV